MGRMVEYIEPTPRLQQTRLADADAFRASLPLQSHERSTNQLMAGPWGEGYP